MLANFRLKAVLVLALAALLAPLPSGAVGIRLLHQDATAVARGNAFTATADNPSAIYYNPAGITQLDGQNIEFNTFVVGYEVEYEGKDGRNANTVDKLDAAAQLFYASSLKASRLFFGLGVYTPYGLSSTWRDNSPIRSLATESKLLYVTINPVLAWKISDTFSVGAGVTLNTAHLDLRRGIVARRDEFQFEGDGFAVGFNVGILWQPHPQHSFGARFFSGTDMEFDGRVQVHSETPLLFPSSTESGRTDFDFPLHIAAGYSFRPTPAWNFEFDIDWTEWERVNSVTVHKQSGNIVEAFDWKSSFNYMGGVTRYFDNGFSVSAGYTYIENSSPDLNYHPSTSDMNFHVTSLGVRYQNPRWSAALTYQFAWGDRNVSESLISAAGETADGRYKFRSHSLSISVGAAF